VCTALAPIARIATQGRSLARIVLATHRDPMRPAQYVADSAYNHAGALVRGVGGPAASRLMLLQAPAGLTGAPAATRSRNAS